jgi:two-component system sensor histidine kinase KdpD
MGCARCVAPWQLMMRRPSHLARVADLAGSPAQPPATAAILGVFVGVALAVSRLARDAAGRTGQAAEAVDAIAEADRIRTALLAAVSHDLRTPLAAAQAAVSCLRSADLPLTAQDHDELLATADESLNQLAHLTASLLDVSRLQAGALPVFPRPADLSEIITCSLDGLPPPVPAVAVHCPPGLPRVMADPPLMERVIVNVTANALRYSPAGSPPLLTAGARGDRVELRVIDRGPGIPAAVRDRAFLPFQRLGATGSTTGVGLGLTVSRGLTEAMGGTLTPEETPGGGLTMTISLPAVAQATYRLGQAQDLFLPNERGACPGGQVPAAGLRGLCGGEREPGREDAGQAALRATRSCRCRARRGRPAHGCAPPGPPRATRPERGTAACGPTTSLGAPSADLPAIVEPAPRPRTPPTPPRTPGCQPGVP